MRLEFVCERQASMPSDALSDRFSRVADLCIAAEGLSGNYQAVLMLTDDEGIRALNRAQRGIDRATDVLSFPNTRYPDGRTARHHAVRLRRALDPDTGCMHLGDLVISTPRALEQAKAYGHSSTRELCFLFAHGMLHLLGYDHETESMRHAMREMEEMIMEQAGLPRELTDEDFAVLDAAREAMCHAYVPYSGYRVGACVRAVDGRLFSGCNVENASYSLTICAERNAVSTAITEGATVFDRIAIVADGAMPYPCGACRQVLREFARDMRVLVSNGEATCVTTLSVLLPDSFGPESLQEEKA